MSIILIIWLIHYVSKCLLVVVWWQLIITLSRNIVSDSVSFERLMKYRGAQEERELSNNDSNRRNERKRLANLEGAIGGRSSQR